MNFLPSSLERLTSSDKSALPVPLVTPRLELRPFDESDIGAIADLLGDAEVTKYIGDVKSREIAAESVRTMRDAFLARGWGTLAVVPREGTDNRCVGYCGVRPLPHTCEVEIAFALHRRCWNRGYATEAATATVDAAFNILKIASIVATVYPDNSASVHVLEKLGMSVERKVFGHWPMTTALLFRLSAEDWKRKRAL